MSNGIGQTHFYNSNNRRADVNINYSNGCNQQSTGQVLGSIGLNIFDAALSVAEIAFISNLTAHNADKAANAGTATIGTHVNAKIQAQSVINTLSPQLDQLRARYDAANKNYKTEKDKLEGDLKELNAKVGINATNKTTTNLKALADLRTALAEQKSNAATYNSNKEQMTSLLGETVSTPKGPMKYITDDGNVNNAVTSDTFRTVDSNKVASLDNYATTQFNEFKTIADRMSSQYKNMKTQNEAFKKAASKYGTTPDDAVNHITTKIAEAEQAAAKDGDTTNNSSNYSCKEYETKKAAIEKKLQQLESDKDSSALTARIQAMETEIANQEMIVAKADAAIQANMKITSRIETNNNDIDGLKSAKKKAGKRQGFLGVFGKRQDKVAYKYYKNQIAAKKAENDSLGG